MFTSKNVVFIAYNFLLVRLDIERELNIVTTPCSFSNTLMFAYRTWVEFSKIKPMNRYVQNCRVFQKNLGSTITNMDIPIENANFFEAKLLLCNSSRDCNVINEAKASDRGAMRMMTGRSHNSKRLIHIIPTDCSDCLYRTACGY